MRHRYPPQLPDKLPHVWLVSDARIDDRLKAAIDRLPPRSGLIFRHYHLPPAQRRARFLLLRARARRHGHLIVLSGTATQARAWRADGAYGAPERLAHGPALLRLATAHSLRELGRANRLRADAVLLSPVFATRTHPGAASLGPVRFKLLAARARVPVIALGGMSARRARAIGAERWAAIASLAPSLAPTLAPSLTQPRRAMFPIHS